MAFETLSWGGDRVLMLDQRRLPAEEITLDLRTPEEVARAIEEMAIRGAPAIGCAAALGIALGGVLSEARDHAGWRADVEEACHRIERTRPTARNLFWAVERMRAQADTGFETVESARAALIEEGRRILDEDVAACRRIGYWGRELISNGDRVLTHCNAGALATAGYGTALGVIRGAVEAGRRVHVFADETRPLLQGARLTAWELQKDGIPVTLLPDVAAGAMMRRGEIDLAVVGADRIAANGDTANKIGTYQVAVLARENGVPFYVAAPLTTVDFSIASGDEIPIEERSPVEVEEIHGVRIAPKGVTARNIAFDVTPAALIAGIVTEEGIARPPFEESLRAQREARKDR